MRFIIAEIVFLCIVTFIFAVSTGFVFWPEGIGFMYGLLSLAGSMALAAVTFYENIP